MKRSFYIICFIILIFSVDIHAASVRKWSQDTGEIKHINIEKGLLTINTDSGDISVNITNDTVIIKSKKKVDLKELHMGDPVVFRYKKVNGENRAIRIRTGAVFILGTVQSVDAGKGEIKVKSHHGNVILKLQESVSVKKGKAKAKIQDISIGDYVKAAYKRSGNQNLTSMVDIIMKNEEIEKIKKGKKGKNN